MKVLRENGFLVSVTEPPNTAVSSATTAGSNSASSGKSIRGGMVHVAPNRNQLDQVFKWLTEGRLQIHIERDFAAEDWRKAMEASQLGRTRGKLILNWS
jgi:NADPH:quinone reductase-like Zn-dependent oxidoreductase